MKYLPLIWTGIWRKPGRTVLITLQVSVAFLLFGVLQGMKTGVQEAVERTRADLLLVLPNAVGEPPLPLAYADKLRSIAGVKSVTFADGILGTYQKPDQGVYVLGIDPDDIWLTLVPDILKVAPQDLQALRATRNGVLISAEIGKKYHWKVGDRIPLTSPVLQRDGTGNWSFDVVGMFAAHEVNGGSYIVGNYAYVDESRVANKSTVRNFYVVIADPGRAAAISASVDQAFANSPSETSTATLRENAEQAMESIGDLDFVIRSVVSAVFVALLFSTATMMMQSIRERTPELAVMKTFGFTNGVVFLLIIAEATVVYVVGALVGLSLAMLAFPYTAQWVPGLSMPFMIIYFGVLVACLVAVASASLPALRAAQLRVVDGLADR